MADIQPKAVRQGYQPSAFYFAQTNESGDRRLAAWAPSLSTLRLAFEGLIKALPASLEVLLKIKPDDEPGASSDDQIWERYYGVVSQGALLEAISRCDAFIFQDSRNQLCVRDPASFNYVVLDDVGVIYVYADDAAFGRALVEVGFEERTEPLVSEAPYWTQTPAAGREQQEEFVRLLRLSAVPGPDESRDPREVH